jgi:hypothetical protein
VNVCPAIVSVPVRAAPTFFDTLKPTLPFPVSLAPDVTVIHESLLTAVHEQPAGVVTFTVGPFPPPAFIDALSGLMEYEQPAVWFTVSVWPAIVSVPARAAPPLAPTVNPTEPFPLPVAPDVTEIHPALLVDVHMHPAAVVTLTEGPAPPPAATDAFTGLMAYEQFAAWVRVKVFPAMVTVPERAGPELAVTFVLTEPLPLPVDPDVTVIHPALLVAVHAQPAAAVTVTAGAVEVPAPTEAVAGLTL